MTAGAHSIKVVVAGTAGHPAVALDALVAVYSDVTVPGAPGAPSAGLRTGAPASATALPVTVSWAAAADNSGGSGVGSYQVQRSTDAGVTWGTAAPSSGTTLATTVPTSGTALFRVRAVDRAGDTRRVDDRRLDESLASCADGIDCRLHLRGALGPPRTGPRTQAAAPSTPRPLRTRSRTASRAARWRSS